MTRKILILVTGGAFAAALVGTALGASAAEVTPTRDGSAPSTVATSSDDRSRPAGSSDDSAAGSTGAPSTGTTAVDRQGAIVVALARTGGGDLIKVEIEQEHGRTLWSVRISKDGALLRVDVDARTGQVVRTERQAGDDGSRTGDRAGDDNGRGRAGDDKGGNRAGDDKGGDRHGRGSHD
jgi:uncharacterized membrane protein YkoI